MGRLGTELGALEQGKGMRGLTDELASPGSCSFVVESVERRMNSAALYGIVKRSAPVAGWLVPVAAWLVLPLLSAGECPQKGTGFSGNRGSPASWTGCFFAPRFHLATPRSPLSRCPLGHPASGLP